MVAWPTKNLGDVCDIVGGGTPSKSRQDFYTGSIPWATVRDMNSELVTSTECSITENAVKNSSTNVIPGDNVIIATRVGLGKICMLGQDTAINQDLRGVIPKSAKTLDVGFLFWWLKSEAPTIVAAGTGATVQGVKLPFVKSLQIPLPPLPEQKRIVAILDEAFAGIDAAVANTEKNLANGRELFESYLNGVFTRKGEGWVEKRLGEYSSSVSTGPFGSLLHKSDYVSTGVPLVNPINIVGRNIVPNNSKLIDKKTKKRLESYVLHQGDIIIARRGEIGRCAVINSEHDGWVCGTGCFFMKPLPSVNPHFLANLIRSQGYREKLEKVGTGATMKNLSNKTLSNLPVSIPNLEKQTEILAKFDELDEETQHLETIYQQKLIALAELKQSILQKAFAGELTAHPVKALEEAVA